MKKRILVRILIISTIAVVAFFIVGNIAAYIAYRTAFSPEKVSQSQAQSIATEAFNTYRTTLANGDARQAKADFLKLTDSYFGVPDHHVSYWKGSRDPILCTDHVPPQLFVMFVSEERDSAHMPYYFYVNEVKDSSVPGGVYVGIDSTSGEIIDLFCDS